MGRSAKLHKRVQKKSSNTGGSKTASSVSQHVPQPIAKSNSASESQSVNTKRRSALKNKAQKRAPGQEHGHVLGGADYVDLMFGSRKRAKEEAAKLPKDD